MCPVIGFGKFSEKNLYGVLGDPQDSHRTWELTFHDKKIVHIMGVFSTPILVDLIEVLNIALQMTLMWMSIVMLLIS